MEKEKELEKILKHLASMGFEGPEVERQLTRQLTEGVTDIRVECRKDFGNKLILYDLHLKRDKGDGDGLSVNVHARLRAPVEIEQKLIDGIDTAQLDREMSEIDWYRWYYQDKNASSDNRIEQVMENLGRLFKSHDKEGLKFQQLLMYKHSPPDLFEYYLNPAGTYLETTYENSEYFRPEDWPYLSAGITYLYLSGGLKNLRNDIGQIMDGSMPKERIKTVLLQKLKKFPEGFQIEGTLNRPDYFLDCSIPVARDEEKYFVGPYSLSLTAYPEIEHGRYNGIDSEELEAKMMAIDWDVDDELFVFNDEETPQFKPAIKNIMSALVLLEQDPNGAKIADLLRLKYHQEVPFLEHHIPESAWELFNSLPKVQGTFPTDMKLSKAKNLLQGSAVQYPLREGVMLAGNDWVRLSLATDSSTPFLLTPLKGPSYLEIESMLIMLHILVPGAKGYINPLLDGYRITVETELGKKFQVQVDAEQFALKVWTMDEREIPFNFHMDPEFTAGNSLQHSMETKREKEITKPVIDKGQQRKGPSM